MEDREQIAFKIANNNILIKLPYAKENFIIGKYLQLFSIIPSRYTKPDVVIETRYSSRIKIPTPRANLIADAGKLKIFSTPRTGNFFFIIEPFSKSEGLLKKILKRKLEYKKYPFYLETPIIFKFNREIIKKVLPLPYRIAIFDSEFRKGYIYVKEDKGRRCLLPHPLEAPLLKIFLSNLLVSSKNRGAIFHSSAVVENNKSYLFIGPRGSGKSTMAKIWSDKEKSLIQDESIIIQKAKGTFLDFPTPGFRTNLRPPFNGTRIDKIFFLYHSKKNEARQLKPSKASYLLLGNSAFHSVVAPLDHYIEFCKELASQVPCYSLGFVPNSRIVDFIRRIK